MYELYFICIQAHPGHPTCSLPPSWVHQSNGLCKLESSEGHSSEVTRCIVIQSDYTWKAFIHGRELAHSSIAVREIDDTIDSNTLQQLVNILDQYQVCHGNPEEQFVSLVENRNGCIKRQNGSVSAYLDKLLPVDGVSCATVRSMQCDLISSGSKCASCSAYRKNLRAMVSSGKVSSPVKRKRLDASSHTNYRYLHSPDLRERLHNSRKEICILSREVEQLKSRINKMTQSVGVTLDSELDSDIQAIMCDNDTLSHPPDSFAKIFWDQQKESLQKHPKQMRWHPMMIKWCIHLRMLSSSCYNSFRSSGVVRLPSDRTLRDYTHVIKAQSGFQREVDEQLAKEANINNEHQKYVALVFDEVKVKEDLVYNKHSGELIGFVNLSDIGQHLSALEHACNNENNLPQLATHMLVFMVRGICSALKFPYAQFPVKASSGGTLHPIVWECVEHLESIGLKVLAFVSDGASCNRKFYKMHGEKGCESPHKIKNIYAEEDRPIFLISDVPHLLKTTRNSWANSHAHANTRHLWVRTYYLLRSSMTFGVCI